MNYQDKTKEELLKELGSLQRGQSLVKDKSIKDWLGSSDLILGRRLALVLLSSIFVGELLVMLIIQSMHIKSS